MSQRQTRAALAAVLFAVTPFTLAPFAANAQTRSIAVHTADLNLASANGRATLKARIGNAVETICGHPRTAQESEAYAACSRNAFAGAETQADALAAAAQNAPKMAGQGDAGQKDTVTVR